MKKICNLQENPAENSKSQIDTTSNHVNRNINEPQPCISDVESVIQSCVTNIADEQQEGIESKSRDICNLFNFYLKYLIIFSN